MPLRIIWPPMWFPALVFGQASAQRIIRMPNSINLSSRSYVLPSFGIHYSLFDIRYSHIDSLNLLVKLALMGLAPGY